MTKFVRFAVICLVVVVATAAAARACTIFSGVAENGHVWNGNNEDGRLVTDDVFVNVYPKSPGSRFGYFTLTLDEADTPDIQGGMNEAGLTFDFNALDRKYPVKNREKKKAFPRNDEDVIPYMLGHFQTVEEVVAYFDKHWLASDEIFTRCQMHVADKQGHFAIIAPSGSRIVSERSFQVSTNFNICGGQDGSSCWRFPIAKEKLKDNPASLPLFTEICSKTAQQGSIKTIYSNIQNLNTGDVWFFFDGNYESPFKTNIRDLLAVGKHSSRISDFCKQAANYDKLARKIPKWLEDFKVPAAAVASIDLSQDNSTWVRVFGDRIAGTPATKDTVFNTASLTKPVFAMMVLQLIANGELKLDQNLDDYWLDPDIAENAWHKKLTPRLLLSHQSGFPNWRNGKLAFHFEPGTKMEYSGEGIDYLRKAVERKTKSDMEKLMEKHVLKKTAMTTAKFGWNDSIKRKFAPGHEFVAGREAKVQDLSNITNRKPSGAGSMFSTIGDYSSFVTWVLNGADLPPSLYREMQTPQGQHSGGGENIGLAWHLIPSSRETVLYHEGRETGVYTICVILPESKRGIVVLTNGDNGELVARQVLSCVLPDGRSFIRAKSSHMLRMMRDMSRQELEGIIPVITSSPTYMGTLFLAIESDLLKHASVDEEHLQTANSVFQVFIAGMTSGEIRTEQAKVIVAQITERNAEGLRLIPNVSRVEFDRVVEAAASMPSNSGNR